jgi:NAD(P)-dependent dehydrogenase (short-subunit alcohol dehydrogenase family)
MTTVLVTGCSSGFGAMTALALARRGDRVFATVRKPDAARALEGAAAGLSLSAHILDVTDQASIDRSVAEIAAAGGVDVLINNAGFAVRGPVADLRDEDLLWQFDTNVFGVVRMVRAVVPLMLERGNGTIINISSAAGLIGVPFEGAYVASKHAVEGLTEVMRLELAGSGIAVMLVEPGAFSTGFGENIAMSAGFAADHPQRANYERFFSWRDSAFDTGNPPDPQEVVNAILDAVDNPDGPFRRLVGRDAEMVGTLTRQNTFEDYERIIQSAFGSEPASTTVPETT